MWPPAAATSPILPTAPDHSVPPLNTTHLTQHPPSTVSLLAPTPTPTPKPNTYTPIHATFPPASNHPPRSTHLRQYLLEQALAPGRVVGHQPLQLALELAPQRRLGLAAVRLRYVMVATRGGKGGWGGGAARMLKGRGKGCR
jgi:hypothetical protein